MGWSGIVGITESTCAGVKPALSFRKEELDPIMGHLSFVSVQKMCTPKVPHALFDIHAFKHEDLGVHREGELHGSTEVLPCVLQHCSKSPFSLKRQQIEAQRL